MGEIVEWSKGSGLSRDALNIQGIGVPVIHYADLYKFNSVQKEVIHWTMNDIGTKIPENNLLFPMSDVTPDGLARTSTVLQSNVKAGGDVLIAKLNKDILSTFMSYQINRNKNQILPLVTGTTVRHINSKSLSTLKVTVTGKNEQKYVGSILMRFDSLIALHQRKLDHLEEQKKGFLQKMFPKKGQTVPEIRFPGFTDAWEQRRLGEVGKTQSGIGFPNKEQGGHQGIPFFKVSDMNNEGNEFEMKISNNYVTEIQIANRKWKPISEVPAVVFAKVGAALMLNRKRLVKVPFLIDNNTMAYIFSNEWDPYFGKTLFDTLNLPRYAQIGALPSFNGSDIENIKVMLPSLREQQALSHFFQNINSLIALHQRKLNHLKLLRKSLLQQVFI